MLKSLIPWPSWLDDGPRDCQCKSLSYELARLARPNSSFPNICSLSGSVDGWTDGVLPCLPFTEYWEYWAVHWQWEGRSG